MVNQPYNPGYEAPLFTEDIYQKEEATRGQRFLNWLIDNLLMRFGINIGTSYAVGHFLYNYFEEFYIRMILEQGVEYYLTVFLITYLNYLFYYTICEKAFRGYTLGKLVTGTRAIREDGGELTFKDAFLRSLSRLVPFEVFSGFGTPWHDSWTKTMVIKAR